jgi:hypothetical protein
VGAAAAGTIGAGKGKRRIKDRVEGLGDIGDDGNYFLGDIDDEPEIDVMRRI